MLLLTRRRDQRGYDGGPCGNQIIGGIVICETPAARDAWIERLNKRHPLRFNHFTKFYDVHGPAVQFGHAYYEPPPLPAWMTWVDPAAEAMRRVDHPYIQH